MHNNELAAWEHAFRKAAKANCGALFRELQGKFGMPGRPAQMLDATVAAVAAVCVYAAMDQKPVDDFLAMQTYDPLLAFKAEYVFVFSLSDRGSARLLVPATISMIDLADLLGHPFLDHEYGGYDRLWMARVDGQPLSPPELKQLEKDVIADLYYDYIREELATSFDVATVPGCLAVSCRLLDCDYESLDEDGAPTRG